MRPSDRPAVSRSLVLVLLLGLVVSACTRTRPPAPVVSGSAVTQRPGAIARYRGPHPDNVVVASGETLYSVAQRYDVPIRSLIEVNHLTPPFRLVTGQRLILPQVRQYVVQPGDTLYGVSRRFGVDASTLARSNDLASPYPIHVGQALILPAQVQVVTASRTMPVPASTPVPIEPARPETSRPSAEPLPPIVSTNPGATSNPPPGMPAKPGAPIAPGQTQTALATPAPRTETAPPAKVEAPVAPKPAEPQAFAAPPVREPPLADPPHTGRGFQWPVRGSILVNFGPGESGTHNDGINIAAAKGTPIAAANDGVVAYAGNELRGFGNLILIKHADGWTTAYAHCDSLLVKRGDRVRRGQTIAKVGATGAVSEPQLHFEIRRGTRALDPATYLPPTSTASAQ
jgi:murein DD-endopeptidase MepM/ murein hydrolase activator NlpD